MNTTRFVPNPSPSASPETPNGQKARNDVIFYDGTTRISLIVDLSIVLDMNGREIPFHTIGSEKTSTLTVTVDPSRELTSVDKRLAGIGIVIGNADITSLLVGGNFSTNLGNSPMMLEAFSPNYLKYMLKDKSEGSLFWHYQRYLEKTDASGYASFVKGAVNAKI
jgi:hypothetical protein